MKIVLDAVKKFWNENYVGTYLLAFTVAMLMAALVGAALGIYLPVAYAISDDAQALYGLVGAIVYYMVMLPVSIYILRKKGRSPLFVLLPYAALYVPRKTEKCAFVTVAIILLIDALLFSVVGEFGGSVACIVLVPVKACVITFIVNLYRSNIDQLVN